MERKLTTISPFYAATAAVLTLTAVVAGCGGGTKNGAAGQPSGSTRQAVSGKTAEDSLAKSHLRVLTKLRRSQLCHVLSTAEAVSILHARTAPPVYTSHPGVAVTCQWIKRGQGRDSGAQLYVGISASINWTGTQAVDRSLHSKSVTIDGRHALAATRRGTVSWAQVDVALGGGDDPVAEYRAPTMAAAQALARAATPHIIALG
jgi:hypothetical protein